MTMFETAKTKLEKMHSTMDFHIKSLKKKEDLLSKTELSKTEDKHYKHWIEYEIEGINGTIDESPFAYKDSSEIIRNISNTVEIIEHIYPIYIFKAN